MGTESCSIKGRCVALGVRFFKFADTISMIKVNNEYRDIRELKIA